MPSSAFLPLTALMGSAATVNAAKFYGALDGKTGQGIWRSWQDFLGMLGIAMLPQVMPFIATGVGHHALCSPAACLCCLCLQAIWAICSKHHTMLPATVSSLVALTYLFMVHDLIFLLQVSQNLHGRPVSAWRPTSHACRCCKFACVDLRQQQEGSTFPVMKAGSNMFLPGLFHLQATGLQMWRECLVCSLLSTSQFDRMTMTQMTVTLACVPACC